MRVSVAGQQLPVGASPQRYHSPERGSEGSNGPSGLQRGACRLPLRSALPVRRPFPLLMAVEAVLEIVTEPGRELPSALIEAAYSASRAGIVVLALRGVTPDIVDRVLDPLVVDIGREIHGVVYIDANDLASVVDVATRARLVMAVSPELRESLRAREIDCCGVEIALATLVSLSSATRHTRTPDGLGMTPVTVGRAASPLR
jgi:hypothetical protein